MKAFSIFFMITTAVAGKVAEILPVDIGEDIILQCHYEVKTKITLVEWTRPDLESPEYVFLYRDERPCTSYQHPSFAGRVELKDKEMKDGDVSIILRNVNISDAGVYECRVVQDGRRRVKRTNINTEPIRVINLEVKPLGDMKRTFLHIGAAASLTLLMVAVILIIVKYR